MPPGYYMKRCGSFQMFGTSGPPTAAMRKNLAMAPTDDKDDAATERDVMSALPRTRPQRRSARRAPAAPAAAGQDGARAQGAKPARKAKAAGRGTTAGRAKPTPRAKPAGRAKAADTPATAKPGSAAAGRAKPRTTAAARAKPRATAARPRPAAQAKAAAAPKAPAAAAAAPAARSERGRQAEEIPAAGYATERGDGRPGTGELVTTAFQAVGELAQIGVTVGGQALRSALSRLPRP